MSSIMEEPPRTPRRQEHGIEHAARLIPRGSMPIVQGGHLHGYVHDGKTTLLQTPINLEART